MAKKNASDDTLRAENLRHETTIRTVGMLYYAAAVFLALGAAVVAVRAGGAITMRLLATLLLLAAGYGFAGYMLRRLDARARYAATLMAVIGLPALPVGTVLNGYVLFLVHSRRGRTVLTPEYREVVARTPQFQCRVAHSVLAMGMGLAAVAVYGAVRLLLAASL